MREQPGSRTGPLAVGLLVGLVLAAAGIFSLIRKNQAEPTRKSRVTVPDSPSASETIIVVVDVQKDFWIPEVSSAHPNFEENVSTLLQRCRQLELPLVHVRTTYDSSINHWPADFHEVHHSLKLCEADSSGAQPLSCAVETGEEPVFVKGYFDSFSNREFEQFSEMWKCGMLSSVVSIRMSAS